MTPDEIIEAIQLQWQKDFGGLQKELPSIDCYFLTGFIAAAIDSWLRNKNKQP